MMAPSIKGKSDVMLKFGVGARTAQQSTVMKVLQQKQRECNGE